MPLVSFDIPCKQKIFSGMKSFVEGLPLNCDYYPKIDTDRNRKLSFITSEFAGSYVKTISP